MTIEAITQIRRDTETWEIEVKVGMVVRVVSDLFVKDTLFLAESERNCRG